MPKGQPLVKSNKPKPPRAEILAMYDQGHTTSEVCAALGVCSAWARRVKIRWAWLRNVPEARGGFCDCEVMFNVVPPPAE